jgi:hypothetical protein
MGPRLPRLQQTAMLMAVVGGILSAIGLVVDRPHFFESYLYAYMFWFGVTLGSLALLMLHHTVGGGWGFIIRRFLEAATRLLPWMALLFLPIILPLFLPIPALYRAEFPGPHGETFLGWAHPNAGADLLLRAKSGYLNVPRFLGFAALYFLIWWTFARLMNTWGATQDERSDPAVAEKLNKWAAFGILVYVLTLTFAVVDWVMSLTPQWLSSIFGLLAVASQSLSTLALMLVLIWALASDTALVRGLPSGYFRDLGNLTLATVMLWAYMAFSQYLITYSGNTAEEVSWYIARQRGGWAVVSVALIALHFALPFLVLLTGDRIKRDPARLGGVALFIIIMRHVDLFWLVAPTFRLQWFVPSAIPADLGAPLLLGGIWLILWIREVKDKPIVPLFDPRLQAGLAHAAESGHEVVSHG